MVAAVAAAFVALAAIGAVWAVQERRLDEARAQAQVLHDAQVRVAAIEAAGDRQVHTAGVPGGGSVTVTLSHDLDDAVVVVADLPAPPAGEVYQLWRITDGVARSIGILGEGQRGGMAFLGAVADADTVGVTLERWAARRRRACPSSRPCRCDLVESGQVLVRGHPCDRRRVRTHLVGRCGSGDH
jgi:hypothetical protein